MTAVELAYVDTNIVSAIAKNEHEDQVAAFLQLRAMPERLSLCTSRVMADELARYGDELRRRPQLELYEALAQLPFVPDSFQTAPITSLGSRLTGGPIFPDPRVTELEALVLGPAERRRDDARHLFQAWQNGADYFVTVDVKSILNASEAIEAAVHPMRLRRPSELRQELTGDVRVVDS